MFHFHFIEGRPIVSGPVYYTISQILYLILKPSLSFIPHILKDSFGFLEHLDTRCTEDTLLSSCDIESLYTKFGMMYFTKLFYKTIEKLINEIALLRRFTKSICFRRTFNNFRIRLLLYHQLYHQIKGSAMGTIFAVVGSNLTVAYSEEKMFAILPQIYPKDFVDFFIRNYFRFLDDVFHKWLIQDLFKMAIQTNFYKIMNELDLDLQFIFEELTRNTNFLDVNLKIINNKLYFDI